MLFKQTRILIVIAIAVACAFAAVQGASAANVVVGRKVASSSRVSIDRIDHRVWDALLQKYVDSSGNVDYTSWKASAADVKALDGYLSTLSMAEPKIRASHEAKLAFWINAYNAVTVKGILREYPATSIRNHTARFIGYNIWKNLLLIVGDETPSLEGIEHEILRKTGEPRIHFAIVCASHSCPRLLNMAYTADNLEAQLVANTKHFFANPENFRCASGALYLSSIMKWFATDFGSDSAAQLRTIAPYLRDRAMRTSVRVTRRHGRKKLNSVDPNEWVDQHGDFLYRLALSRLRNSEAAEVAVQETFVAGLRAAEQFAGKGSERAWLLGILKRKVIDFVRACNHLGLLEPDRLAASVDRPICKSEAVVA